MVKKIKLYIILFTPYFENIKNDTQKVPKSSVR